MKEREAILTIKFNFFLIPSENKTIELKNMI